MAASHSPLSTPLTHMVSLSLRDPSTHQSERVKSTKLPDAGGSENERVSHRDDLKQALWLFNNVPKAVSVVGQQGPQSIFCERRSSAGPAKCRRPLHSAGGDRLRDGNQGLICQHISND